MPGSKAGGAKAAATMKRKYGADYYQRIGTDGGRKGVGKIKGFAANPELASIAGKKGGKISRRNYDK